MTNIDLEQLITEYGRDIYSFCVHLTGSRELADDLYQETFLTAVRRRFFLGMAKDPKAYLLSVAVHIWTNMKRKYARRMEIAPAASFDEAFTAVSEDDTEAGVLAEETQKLVRRAVDRLPEKLRVVILLHYMENMEVKRIAGILHIPSGTVKSRLKRARNVLAGELEELQDE